MSGPGVPRQERLEACLLLGSGTAEKALKAHGGFSPIPVHAAQETGLSRGVTTFLLFFPDDWL